MRHICSCSFGKDSMATVILAHEKKRPLDIILYSEVMYDIEKNISGEIPEHREFIYKKAIPLFESWGYEVVIVKSNKDYKWNFYKLIENSKIEQRNGLKRGFPLCGKCAINRDSKIPPILKYYKDNSLNDIIQYVGIAADEKERLKRLEGTNKVSLLAEYGYTESMAKELCVKYDLLSPIYEFTSRGGCWFCPNCKDEEFLHMYRNHKQVWNDLVALGEEKGTVSDRFNRTETIKEINERIMWMDAQMDIFDFL